MAEETNKKGILSKLFRPRRNCCCNMKIEEIADTARDRDPVPRSQSACCPKTQPNPEQK